MIFLVLLAILWRFAWGPLAAGLDKREKSIADQIDGAAKANQEAKELLARYEQKLAAAEEEVRAIVQAGGRDAEKIGQEMIDKAKAEAAAEQQRALEHIDAATAGALKELSNRIGFRVIPGFAERVIFRELFLHGLTLLDLKKDGLIRLTLSHVAARQELRDMLKALDLPEAVSD